jgi:SAM-dependent methyltransferase
MLDFGCGSGASTLAMAKMLPQTEVTGLELAPERVELAERIKSHRGFHNAQFQCSPAADSLPPGIGKFDFVMLSAVYEHLLPDERKIVMPLLWSAMNPGGVIFINQTPYRYSPYEAHSTGLWFINYMPDRAAHWTVRHFARRGAEINKSADWNVHLRGGLRGATEREIVRNLTRGDRSSACVLQPRQNGLRDRADFWFSSTNPRRHRLLKRSIAVFFRFTDRHWGTVPGLNLEVVIEKLRDGQPGGNFGNYPKDLP